MARETKKKSGVNWRLWMGLAALVVACVSTAVAGLKVREYALTEPQFVLSRDRTGSLTVEGLQHTQRLKVQRIFAGDFARKTRGN